MFKCLQFKQIRAVINEIHYYSETNVNSTHVMQTTREFILASMKIFSQCESQIFLTMKILRRSGKLYEVGICDARRVVEGVANLEKNKKKDVIYMEYLYIYDKVGRQKKR